MCFCGQAEAPAKGISLIVNSRDNRVFAENQNPNQKPTSKTRKTHTINLFHRYPHLKPPPRTRRPPRPKSPHKPLDPTLRDESHLQALPRDVAVIKGEGLGWEVDAPFWVVGGVYAGDVLGWVEVVGGGGGAVWGGGGAGTRAGAGARGEVLGEGRWGGGEAEGCRPS